MTSLTIIIPFLKETETELFEGTLVSVLENRPADAEILVINAAEYDNCYDISSEEGVRFSPADPGTGLIEAINLGLQNADSPFVHPILCGCRVTEGWTEPAMAQFACEKTAAVVPAIFEEETEAPLLSGFAFRTDGLLIPQTGETPLPAGTFLAPSVRGAFFRRRLLPALGLFRPQFGVFAYVDTALLLSALGKQTVFEANSSLLYGAGVTADPSRSALITGQEQLFRQWAPLLGNEAAGAHRSRLFKEKFAAFFSGKGAMIKEAYKKGRLPVNLPSCREIIDAAKAVLAHQES